MKSPTLSIPNLISKLALRWLDYRTRVTFEKHVAAAEPVAIKHVEATPDYTSILASHPLFADLVRSVAELYDEIGGPNYVDLKLAGPLGAYLVTVAPLKPGVKTKHEINDELKEQVAGLEGHLASLQAELAEARGRGDVHRDNWAALYVILRDLVAWIDDAATHGYITVPTVPVDRWHRPVAFARAALDACPTLAQAIYEHNELVHLRASRAGAAAEQARTALVSILATGPDRETLETMEDRKRCECYIRAGTLKAGWAAWTTEPDQALTDYVFNVLEYVYRLAVGKPWESDRGPLTANTLISEVWNRLEDARMEVQKSRLEADRHSATWFSIALRVARNARKKERERCAAIAQDLDCEEWPPEYRIADPEIDPYMPEWEKAQCYHGDRIAAVILGQEDVRA